MKTTIPSVELHHLLHASRVYCLIEQFVLQIYSLCHYLQRHYSMALNLLWNMNKAYDKKKTSDVYFLFNITHVDM